MSSSLDLNGGTVTLTADSTNYYYQITDSAGGGSLIMNAGSSIIFDDTAGAGFDTSVTSMTITINGNSTSECYIESPDSAPTNTWTMPNNAVTLTATRCTFTGYSYPYSAPGIWILNSCTFSPPTTAAGAFSFTPWLSHTISLESVESYNTTGIFSYGAITTVPGRVWHRMSSIVTQDEKSVTSDYQIAVDGSINVNPFDRVTLPNGVQRFVKGVINADQTDGNTAFKMVYV